MPDTALVDSIYEAALIPGRWPTVLEGLCTATGSASSALLLCDGSTPPRWQSTERTRDVLQGLSRTQVWKNPGRSPKRLIQASAGGRLFHCIEDLIPRRQLDRDEAYRAYQRQGLAWQLGTAIPLPSTDVLIATFERSVDDGRHDDTQLARLHAVRPHLARAAMVASRLGFERQRGALDALAALRMPAALLDRRGRVREANVWMTPDLIAVRADGRVVLGTPQADASLEAILRGQTRSRAIALPVADRLSRCVAQIIPVCGAARDLFSGSLALLVIHGSGAASPQPRQAMLRAWFDLSPAESQLAAELTSGISLTAAAARCGIRISTARSYLERIFHKTGCHRQAELVGLLARLAHPSPDPDGEVQTDP